MKVSQPSFRRKLLAWYNAHARDLPWRESCDPYRVWVSEIMLQQTRVAAVIEHYHRFLLRFPTVQKLAGAREASVLAAWSGLGYYRRARMLHAAAKVVVRELSGKFPSTAEAWRELPGIGRYTAAAIASIAFGEPVAVVDGNVERVLSRVLGRRVAGEELWVAAEELLDRKLPGDFNQAMMELGATVCTPRAPGCLTCPVVEMCATRGELAGSVRPGRQRKREIYYALSYRDGAGRDGEVFLVQRAREASLMAGMWELPEVAKAPVEAGSTDRSAEALRHPKAKRRSERTQASSNASLRQGTNGKCAGAGDGPQPFLTLRHSITVTDYTVRVWRGNASVEARGEWVAVERLGRVALTGLARKILRKAEIL